MTFEDTVEGIRVPLREGRFPNEAAVSNGVVLPILQGLDWPVFNPSVVVPQYPVESPAQASVESKTRVDFALCAPTPSSSPSVFIEVKRAGILSNPQEAGKALDQLMQYAFKSGVGIAVLTDGQEWGFYLPAVAGNYSERQVYKLDLLERDIPECCSRLRRYLARNDVEQGVALSNARADHQASNRQSKIEETLPIAWKRLLEDADESLVESLSGKVEDLCGFKPDLETCSEFLSALLGVVSGQFLPGPKTPSTSTVPVLASIDTGMGFTLGGQRYQCERLADLLVAVFEQLAKNDPTFPERLAARKHGNKWRYIARTREELYPGQADFCEKHATERFGWFIGTYPSRPKVKRIVEMECEVAGLKFGSDLILHLG